jgi:hypothetical protein
LNGQTDWYAPNLKNLFGVCAGVKQISQVLVWGHAGSRLPVFCVNKTVERKLKRVVNKFLRIERLLKDGFSMDSGGKCRRGKRDIRMTRYEERYSNRFLATALESLLGILAISNKFASARILL